MHDKKVQGTSCMDKYKYKQMFRTVNLDMSGLLDFLRVLHAEADMGDFVALVTLAELLLHHGDAGVTGH